MTEPRLIDANKLIESIENELWDWQTVDGILPTLVLKQTISDIRNAPTIDAVSVVYGHWIIKKTSIGNEYTVCSSCKTDFAFRTNRGTIAKIDMRESNYCPNCGSKMDEVSE